MEKVVCMVTMLKYLVLVKLIEYLSILLCPPTVVVGQVVTKRNVSLLSGEPDDVHYGVYLWLKKKKD
jgi:hypothetical protein